MAIGAAQLVDAATADILDNGWTGTFYYALVTVEGSDAWDTWSDISASLPASGDYDEIDAGTPSTSDVGGQRRFILSADANFGNPVTITAKTLVCLRGAEAAPLGTDKIIFWVDLDTAGGDVSSSAGSFSIARPTSPAAGVWFTIGAQA